MKLVWSPETASKAYIDTVKSCELFQGSGVAELISAMAAGWNAKLIVETYSHGGPILASIGLAIAARHTGGRHVCIVADHRSRSTYTKAFSAVSPAMTLPEIIVGDPEEVMSELDGVDFMVVDGDRRDFSRFLRLARLGHRGAVLLCKNAGGGKTAPCGVKWRGVVDGCRRVVRTAYLPVGDGLEMAHVASPGSPSSSSGSKDNSNNKKRWIKHFDQSSGEEHVIRTT
ncbi:hypothetical protein RND81_08G123600 [Saponaria officinalis]|uniref:Uncharacterized protein n=1 Tax=Saponaria officinalis TaxID=3572 RepID=A0AAW1J7J1_SAPOF